MQQEWDEGLEQLQLIFVVVLMPWLGKFWGRKWAHSRMSSYPTLHIQKPADSDNL
jgi:Mitochondrial import 2